MRGGSARWALVLPEVVPADRVLVADILGAPDGAVRSVALARRAGSSRRALPPLDEQVVVMTAGRGALAPTPLRVATFRAAGSGAAAGEISVTLGPLVAHGNIDILRDFLTREGALPAGLRSLVVPATEAADPAEAWKQTVDDIAGANPGGYEDICFLRILERGPETITIQCRVPGGDLPSDGTLSALDAKGRAVASAPIAGRVELGVGSGAVQVEARSTAAHGLVTIPAVARPTTPDPDAPPSTTDTSRRPLPPQSTWAQNVAFQVLDFADANLKPNTQHRAELIALLVQSDPTSAELRFLEGRAWLDAGNPGAARRAIETVDAARRSAVAEGVLLVAELQEGWLDESDDRYARASLDSELFAKLKKAVAALEPATRVRAVEYLVQVLEASRAAALAMENRGVIPAGRALLSIATRVADHAPSDAVSLLESVGSLEDLDRASLELILNVRRQQGERKLGDALALLLDRLTGDGKPYEAANLLENFQHQLAWHDLLSMCERLAGSIASTGSEWDIDREYAALIVASAAATAIRQQMQADLPEALVSFAGIQAAFGTGSAEVNAALQDLDLTLTDAWESSETYRTALDTVSDQLEPTVRDRWAGKRLLIIGGRKPVWYPEIEKSIGLADKSEWIPSEPAKRPSQDLLRAKISGGKLDLLVILVDYIAHSTSDIRDFARERKILVADARSGRYSFLKALAATK